MTTTYLQLTAHDPIVARDGRPFGVGQGNRMKGLSWPYPSVVAGSFRTALTKFTGGDFAGDMPRKLLAIAVAGVFPVAEDGLYLPAPNDCIVEEIWAEVDGKKEKKYVAHQAVPADMKAGEGSDWPGGALLQPVLIDRKGDFKPATGPAWWPHERLGEWLTGKHVNFRDGAFLSAALSQVRDHVQLEPETGAAAENRLFATAGLSLTHLPRFGEVEGRFADRYADITLSARVDTNGWNVSGLDMLHPFGGERRLVHWQVKGNAELWKCPSAVKDALGRADKIRMVLATPAVFEHGWRPGGSTRTHFIGTPPGTVQSAEIGWASIAAMAGRVRLVMQPQDDPDILARRSCRGPKPIKRLVPAGGVYFFNKIDHPAALADRWLQPVSDDQQDRNDGFGLAVWGTW